MKKQTLEASVGIFVLLGLVCVAYLTIRLGKMEVLGGQYYEIKARFGDVTGLQTGAYVEMAGVQVGQVSAIQIDPKEQVAVVSLRIRKNVELAADVIASVKTSGLIGDKFIKIEPGGAEEKLKPGATITETESAIDLEDLVSKYIFGKV